MRNHHRQTFAMLVSLVGHVVTVGGFSGGFHCIPEFEIPEIEFEFTEVELLDPDMLQGEVPKTEPEPPPPTPEPATEPPSPPPPGPTEDEPPKPEPEKVEEPPKKQFAAKSTKADELAPPTSTFYMLMVPKKIRKLPFKQQVLDIMAPLPDFELLIDKGRFDALEDFDHIVIASPDIRDWTQTFLAVDYKVSREEVQLAIERAAATNGEIIEWIDDGGLLRGNPRPADPEAEDPDNRWFVFLEGKIAIYVRDEFLPSILEGPAEDDRKTSGNFVASLAKVRRFAARQPKAGLQLVVKDLKRSLKPVRGLPFKVPNEAEISVSATKDPELLIRIEFVNVVEAKAFIQWWTEDFAKIIDDSLVLKLNFGGIYEAVEHERDGAKVTLRAEVLRDQAELVFKTFAGFSRELARKTPEEIEEMKRRRVEAMKARKGGKLPPSVLDPKPEQPDPQPEQPEPSPTPTTPAKEDPAPVKPNKTPTQDGASGSVPG